MRTMFGCIALALAIGSPAFGQAKKSTEKTASVPPGPSMADTKTWLETEALPLLRAYDSKLNERNLSLVGTVYAATDMHLEKCVLSWVSLDTFQMKSPLGDSTRASSWHNEIPLRVLEVGSVRVDEYTMLGDKPVQFLRIRRRANAAGDSIRQWKDGEPQKAFPEIQAYVRNRADGERVATAIKRAAVLCGAPASPF